MSEDTLARYEAHISRRLVRSRVKTKNFVLWKCDNCGKERFDYRTSDGNISGVYMKIDGKLYCSSRCVREATHRVKSRSPDMRLKAECRSCSQNSHSHGRCF